MPAVIYRSKDGVRVPSVTTINKIGQPAEGLIAWAWQLGIDGLDYRQVRDDAAKAGEIGHRLVEAAIKQETLDPKNFETKSLAEMALKASATMSAAIAPIYPTRRPFATCSAKAARPWRSPM